MSTNLQNLPSLLNKPGSQTSGATSGVAGGSLADVLGKSSGNDSQTFAKLMSQYQNPQASVQGSLSAGVGAQANAAAQALRAKAAAAQSTAHLQQRQQPPTPAKPETQAQPAKQAQKANTQQNKPNNEARAKPKQADGADRQQSAKADQAGKADQVDAKGEADHGKDDVKFSTAQGEGSAQVRELQPPADVATSDPASMMAWLASLSQSGDAAQATQADGALTEGGAGAAKPSDAAGAGAGKGGPGALPTGTAALTTQLLGQQQALKGDPKMMAAEGQGATAAIAAQDASSPLEFNALMARELARPAGAGASATESTAHASATLPTPVDSPDFKNALAERVGMWVSGTPANGQMTAELRLNPEDMGPVHIRIVMDGQNAQVDFAAAHAETRQALEASLPALSSALEDAGLSLSGGGVSDQGASQAWAQQQQGQGEGQPRAMAWSGRGLGAEQADMDAQAGLAPMPRPAARPGGLDLYA